MPRPHPAGGAPTQRGGPSEGAQDESLPPTVTEARSESITTVEPRGGRLASQPPAAASLAPGTLIGRYVVVQALGAGGMGAVMLAYDPKLSRRVAIKVLLTDVASDVARARMMREAQTMAQLSHPNVVAVYDVGTHEDNLFIAMEYIDGETLRTWLTRPRAWRDVLAVMRQAGRGLAAAHAAGIVHRDFKPSNVVLARDGRVCVLDFGIAWTEGGREATDLLPALAPSRAPSAPDVALERNAAGPLLSEDRLTQAGAVVGTIGYLAPEIAAARAPDARSDVFGFCVTLWRALHGTVPFPHETLLAYLDAVHKEPQTPARGPGVPRWLSAVVEKGLRADPAQRYASMTELLEELERDPDRRRKRIAAGAVVGVAVASAVTALWLGHARDERAVQEVCDAGVGLARETWNDDKRAAVSAALAAHAPAAGGADAAARVVKNLDAYAAAWAAAYREANEATLVRKSETPGALAARLECLDGQRAELGAVVDELAHADAALAPVAISATYQMASPRLCLDPSVLRTALRTAADGSARVTAWRRRLARAQALTNIGHLDQARVEVDVVAREAHDAANKNIEARALFLRARVHEEREDNAEAVKVHGQALALAVASGNDDLAAKAASSIAFLLADRLDRPEDAKVWLALSKGHLARLGPSEEVESYILAAEAIVSGDDLGPDALLALDERLIALQEHMFGKEHPRVATVLNNHGVDLARAGRCDQAAHEFKHAIAIYEQAQAPLSERTLDYEGLGQELIHLGRYDEADATLKHALEGNAPLGENLTTANVLVSTALLANRRRDWPQATIAARHALAVAEAQADNGGQGAIAPALVQLGVALVRSGQVAEGEAACARALALQEKHDDLAPGRAYDDDALRCLGEAALARGDAKAALPLLVRSEGLRRRSSPGELALTRFALAKAMRGTGDAAGARAMGAAAREELARLPQFAGEEGEVEGFLGER